jgi:hypothetical protein
LGITEMSISLPAYETAGNLLTAGSPRPAWVPAINGIFHTFASKKNRIFHT